MDKKVAYFLDICKKIIQYLAMKSGTQEHKDWSKVFRMPPSETRWKDRSRTYTGIADAMAAQWEQSAAMAA